MRIPHGKEAGSDLSDVRRATHEKSRAGFRRVRQRGLDVSNARQTIHRFNAKGFMRGDSGFLTNEFAAELQARKQDRQTDDYPAVLVDGHLVHVFEEGHDWEVWLNCEDSTFSGLCIGVGLTRDAAVRQAVAALEAVVAHLQKRQDDDR
jgi:hypothetical protein